MIEGIHKHLLSELDRAGRSDTIFVLAGVSFNLLVLFINWAQASTITSTYREAGTDSFIIFAIFIIGTLVVSTSCLLTLMNSRRICNKCHKALVQIYEDTEVSKYMPEGMGNLGNKRFILSFIVVGGTGLLAVVVPLVAVVAA
jgi:ABC-type transport system involved in multi-copper enzyme maturation permease subunit